MVESFSFDSKCSYNVDAIWTDQNSLFIDICLKLFIAMPIYLYKYSLGHVKIMSESVGLADDVTQEFLILFYFIFNI